MKAEFFDGDNEQSNDLRSKLVHAQFEKSMLSELKKLGIIRRCEVGFGPLLSAALPPPPPPSLPLPLPRPLLGDVGWASAHYFPSTKPGISEVFITKDAFQVTKPLSAHVTILASRPFPSRGRVGSMGIVWLGWPGSDLPAGITAGDVRALDTAMAELSMDSIADGDDSFGLMVLMPKELLYIYKLNTNMSQSAWLARPKASTLAAPYEIRETNYLPGHETPEAHSTLASCYTATIFWRCGVALGHYFPPFRQRIDSQPPTLPLLPLPLSHHVWRCEVTFGHYFLPLRQNAAFGLLSPLPLPLHSFGEVRWS